MIRLSASFIKDFLSCSKRGQYRISHSEQAVSNDEMLVGTVVHKVLEDKWNSSYDEGVKYSEELVKSNNVNYDLGKKIKKCLKNYYTDFSSIVNEDDEREKFFRYVYKDQVEIVGKLDRVNPKRGLIIDWKTGYRPPETVDSDVQFILYYLAFNSMYNYYPSDVLYVSLFSGKMVKFNPTDLYIKELNNDIIPSIISRMKSNLYVREGLYTKACSNCQFQATCYKDLKERYG